MNPLGGRAIAAFSVNIHVYYFSQKFAPNLVIIQASARLIVPKGISDRVLDYRILEFFSRFHYKLVKKLRSCSKKEKKLRSFVHFTKTRKELGGGRLLLREIRIRPKSTIQLQQNQSGSKDFFWFFTGIQCFVPQTGRKSDSLVLFFSIPSVPRNFHSCY